ncbi:hypothetical protein HY406_01740 [Candidatus Giovannonibacteria bacterium]|nr:hypothetical protein [Candidatus Giovannonibacteria bacterium]
MKRKRTFALASLLHQLKVKGNLTPRFRREHRENAALRHSAARFRPGREKAN